jgi:PDDEXK-like uncharacterized protein DUF3799
MNFDEYRAIPAINFSALKSIGKSAKQFKHDLENGIPDSVGKSLGRATHCAVLEPEKFDSEFAVFDGKTRKGKSYTDFVSDNSNKTILKRDEYDSVMTVAKEVRANPVAAHYLSQGKAEHTIQWKDAVTGLDCKARVDFLSTVDNKVTLIDLKGTPDIRAELFRIEAGKRGYHRQLAYYQNGVCESSGREHVPECVIIAVEFKAPHDVAVFKLEEEAIYAGWEDCHNMLQQVAICRANNKYPGCYDAIQDLVLRKWETGLDQAESVSDLGLEMGEDENE